MFTQVARAAAMGCAMFVAMTLFGWRMEAALVAASIPVLTGMLNVFAGTAYRATIILLAVASVSYAMPAEWSGGISRVAQAAQDGIPLRLASYCTPSS